MGQERARQGPAFSADFSSRVVLVTGAASGIGRAAVQAFCAAGASAVLVDRNEGLLDETEQALRADGYRVLAVAADVTDPEACESMVAQAEAQFGALDIAFNNAGIPSAIGGAFEEIAVEDWQRLINTNLNAAFYCMRAQVPAMKRAGGGAIINTASVASLVAASGMPAYVAAKHGLAGLTKAAALDLIEHNIRVNAVCPGMVDTAMLAPALSNPDMMAAFSGQTPIGRIARAEEVAATVLFLASAAASYMVGELLTVDGGVTLR